MSIIYREVQLGCERWTSFASSCSSTAVQRTLSLWLCASTAVETAIAQCTSRWAMARGHRLNTPIVLAAVHGLSGLFRTVSAVEPSLFRPPVPVPNKPPRFCGRIYKAKWYLWFLWTLSTVFTYWYLHSHFWPQFSHTHPARHISSVPSWCLYPFQVSRLFAARFKLCVFSFV